MRYCETLCCAGTISSLEEAQVLCATCLFGKLTVVLDLDETLVHAVHHIALCRGCVPFCYFENLKIYKRPYVDLFLDTVFERYDVYIWTAAHKSYARKVLAHLLKPKHIPIRVLTRNDTLHIKNRERLMYSCRADNVVKIKPLSKLNCRLSRTVMIDDTLSCFSRNLANGIQIKEFDDPEKQTDDCVLLNLLVELDRLSDSNDVRSDEFLL